MQTKGQQYFVSSKKETKKGTDMGSLYKNFVKEQFGSQQQQDKLRNASQGDLDKPLQRNSSGKLKSLNSKAIDQLTRQLHQGREKFVIEERKPEEEESKHESHLLPPLEITEEMIKSVKKLQSFYRVRKWHKIITLIKKKFNHRKNIVKELMTTEQSYLSDLQLLQQLKSEIEQNKIIDKNSIKTLFINLDIITKLSEDMLKILKEASDRFTPQSKIGERVSSVAPFFKIYYEYCIGYNNSNNVYAELQKNKKFTEFVKKSFDEKKVKGKLEDLLVKPVQRVPRYTLLLADLLKNTPQDHQDYQNILKGLNLFKSVNEQNNATMHKFLSNKKLFELQKFFEKEKDFTILNGKREFKKEDSFFVYQKLEQKPVIVYFLNDVLIITERIDETVNYKLLTYVELDEYSQVKNIEDSDHITKSINVIGKNCSVILCSDTEDNKFNLINYINELINVIKQKMIEKQQILGNANKQNLQKTKYPVTVNILGTQEIHSSMNSFTQYIVEVDIQEITQKIYIRFKDFDYLQKVVQGYFPKLKLPYVKDQSFFNKNDPKVIENRKISIMNFLQSLLGSEEVEKDKRNQEILKILGLPLEFYKLPEMFQKQTLEQREQLVVKSPQSSIHQMSIDTTSTLTPMRTMMTSPRDKFMQSGFNNAIREPIRGIHFQIEKEVEEEPEQSSLGQSGLQKPYQSGITNRSSSGSFQRGRKISASKLIKSNAQSQKTSVADINQNQDPANQVKIKVTLYKFPKNEETELVITPETRGSHAFEDLVNLIGLKFSFDFKLYIQSPQGLRPIEDDELLWNLLVEKQSTSTSSKLSNFIKNVSSKIYKYNQVPVYLRKHIYFPFDDEKSYLEEDVLRIEIISQQIFNDITNDIFHVTEQSECFYITAIYLYLHVGTQLNDKQFNQQVQQFLPQNWSKQIIKETQRQLVMDILHDFKDRVLEAQQKDEMQDQKISNSDPEELPDPGDISVEDPQQEEEETSSIDPRQIAQMILLNEVALCKLYGLKLFEVTMEEKTHIEMNKLCREQHVAYLKTLSKSSQSLQAQFIQSTKIMLCVGYSKIQFWDGLFSGIRPLVQIEYCDIIQTKALPKSLLISLKPPSMSGTNNDLLTIKKEMQLRFESPNSFGIHALMEEYKEVEEILKEQAFEIYNEDKLG